MPPTRPIVLGLALLALSVTLTKEAWLLPFQGSTQKGTLTGVSAWDKTSQRVEDAAWFVFSDPDVTRTWESVDDVARENRRRHGDVGLVHATRHSGEAFRAELPAGDYLLVARNAAGTAVSAPLRATIRAGKEASLRPVLPTPAVVVYRVTDAAGASVAARVTFVSLDHEGRPFEEGVSDRRFRSFESPSNGDDLEVEPGRYRATVWRGKEVLFEERDFTVESGEIRTLEATPRLGVSSTINRPR